jgi:hypothetical protein
MLRTTSKKKQNQSVLRLKTTKISDQKEQTKKVLFLF